ncbi:MAG: hypothetical protein J6J82_03945 [Alphaproteobacteria bacterium]|nr:hypothetical protein [Alphaproteobacteria bacterium]
MKKTVKKTTTKKTNKSTSWFALILSFALGAMFGILIYANIDMFSFGSSAKCLDGTNPDKNGCCAGEVYTDMGDLGYNCCPESGGDCFPPIK